MIHLSDAIMVARGDLRVEIPLRRCWAGKRSRQGLPACCQARHRRNPDAGLDDHCADSDLLVAIDARCTARQQLWRCKGVARRVDRRALRYTRKGAESRIEAHGEAIASRMGDAELVGEAVGRAKRVIVRRHQAARRVQ